MSLFACAQLVRLNDFSTSLFLARLNWRVHTKSQCGFMVDVINGPEQCNVPSRALLTLLHLLGLLLLRQKSITMPTKMVQRSLKVKFQKQRKPVFIQNACLFTIIDFLAFFTIYFQGINFFTGSYNLLGFSVLLYTHHLVLPNLQVALNECLPSVCQENTFERISHIKNLCKVVGGSAPHLPPLLLLPRKTREIIKAPNRFAKYLRHHYRGGDA